MSAHLAAIMTLAGGVSSAKASFGRAKPSVSSYGILLIRGRRCHVRRRAGREDLWSVATENTSTSERGQAAQTMDPNFVLKTLAGRKDDRVRGNPAVHAGEPQQPDRLDRGTQRRGALREGRRLRLPKTKLVDGPLQVEARIDQNAQLSGQLSLWNQQGSHVRRGGLLVIPVGRALLYAEPIYLQAERSPMPELRIVVLALQDRLAYGPTFEVAMAALFGNGQSTLATAPNAPAPSTAAGPSAASTPASASAAPAATDTNGLIAAAAKDLADYQRLTSEGKLGEAGQKLDALKQKLETLNRQRR